MSGDTWAQIIAGVVGVLFTMAFRLIDRYLPDPEGRNPLPKPPLTGAPAQQAPLVQQEKKAAQGQGGAAHGEPDEDQGQGQGPQK